MLYSPTIPEQLSLETLPLKKYWFAKIKKTNKTNKQTKQTNKQNKQNKQTNKQNKQNKQTNKQTNQKGKVTTEKEQG